MTVLLKFQIEIRFFIELHGNSKLSMTSCPTTSGDHTPSQHSAGNQLTAVAEAWEHQKQIVDQLILQHKQNTNKLYRNYDIDLTTSTISSGTSPIEMRHIMRIPGSASYRNHDDDYT